MIGPYKPLDFGALRASLVQLALETSVHRRDQHIIAVLEHSDWQSCCEALCGGLEIAYHCVAFPYPHEVDCFRVHLVQEEIHGPYCTEVSGDGFGFRETNGWDLRPDYCSDVVSDLGTADLCPCPGVLDTCNGGFDGGTVASKMYHAATH